LPFCFCPHTKSIYYHFLSPTTILFVLIENKEKGKKDLLLGALSDRERRASLIV
jgi:hypothetical protein